MNTKLQKILLGRADVFFSSVLSSIGNAGYEITIPRESDDDWHDGKVVAFDFDDTTASTTQTKGERNKRLEAHFSSFCVLSSQELEKLISTTDKFSRSGEEGKKVYYHNKHMQALSFAATQLENGIQFEEVLASIHEENEALA